MSSLQVVSYQRQHKPAWDKFVDDAKNGVFLFRRDYMDYHADRFPDSSLMFYDQRGQLAALLPATMRAEVLTSHAGLTFGGVITNDRMKTGLMLEVFAALAGHLRAQGTVGLLYKAVPHIYHRVPAEEDLYALFRHGAQLVRRDVAVTIDTRARLPFSKGRRWAAKQAEKAGLTVARSFDFDTFISIEAQLLGEKYGARPVHSVAEIELLAARFPDNIKLFAAHRDRAMLGGILIYESAQVAHAQYIGTNEEGRKFGALDLIAGYLINDYYAAKRYFDFGISTEDEGRHLNAGLVKNKEGYGARAVVYDFYQLNLAKNE
jgi:Acetyltransferase (GNAT) domain